MLTLKIILGIIAVVIVLILIVAMLTKNEYAIEREITVGKPRQVVFQYLKHLKNQDYYSKWVMTDPNMKKSFQGTDGNVGFVYAWDGNKNAGKGEQEIKAIIEGNRVDVEIRFIRPFAATAHAYTATEPLADYQTKVRWAMNGRSPFPFNVMNLFVVKMLGKDLEMSLSNLKNNLEKYP